MKKGMAMRSDEGDVGEQDVRASRDLDSGVAELAAKREVESGNRSGADFFVGGSGEQFFAQARRVRKSLERDHARRRTRTLVELDDGGADAIVRGAGHQADREDLAAFQANLDRAHLYPLPDRPRRRPNRQDDL